MAITMRVSTAKEKPKKFEMNTDIMRVDGKYYAVKRIEAQTIDINEELKELYAKRHATHVATLNEGVAVTATSDWQKQIQHIRSFEGKSAKTIPARLFNKPVMVFNNALIELRVITYAPKEMIVSCQDPMLDAVRATKLTGFMGNDTLIVSMTPAFSVPLLVGFCDKTNSLYTPNFNTFHSFSDGRVCTGNHDGKDFWSLSNASLEVEMNRVNSFSPARREVNLNGRTIRLQDLVRPEMVTTARKRGDDTWNV